MMMKGPYRELIPLHDQDVRIQIPPGKKVVKVQLLVSGLVQEYEVSNGYVELVVPKIMDHEVIALDLVG